MSTVDPIAAVLAALDRQALPQPAFADRLLEQLLEELRAPLSHRQPAMPPTSIGIRRMSPRRRWRIAVAMALLLLLVAGIASARYLGVRDWVSSSPRGIQHASAYRLTKVYPAPSPHGAGVTWSSFALSGNGHDLFAVRSSRSTLQLVRVTGIDRSAIHPITHAIDLTRLTPLKAAPLLAVAANDDAFLGVAVDDRPYAGGDGNQRLFVLHPDGSRERILSTGDLFRTGLTQPDGGWWDEIAASAPDRIWIWFRPWSHDPGTNRLVEVVDPNADGRWADRVIRGIALPESLRHGYWQIAAEQSATRPGASDLIAAGGLGSTDIVRLGDTNGDNDLLDAGEVQPLLHASQPTSLRIAPVVVTRDGIARHEIVGAGLSTNDRVSVITDRGVVTDVARAFRRVQAVLAGPAGQIYVVAQHTVYRLDPVPTGANIGASAVTPPEPRVVVAPPPVPSRAPRLIFELHGADRDESLTIGADGTGLRRLIPSAHVFQVCQSADGKAVSYTSDVVVPTEASRYVATLGERPVRVPGNVWAVRCPFATNWLFDGSTRYDARSGVTTRIGNVSAPALSPDGTKLISIGRVTSGDHLGEPTLDLVELETLKRRRLATLERRSRLSIFAGSPGWASVTWSPNSAEITYVTTSPTGRTPWVPVEHRSTVWFRDIASGRTLLRLPVSGSRPSLSLSADGTRLLICIEDRGWQPGCPSGQPDSGWPEIPHRRARLLLVDLRDGTVRLVTHTQLLFAEWDPSGARFAYATRTKLFIGTAAGARRELRDRARHPVAAPVHLLPALARVVAGRPLHRSRHHRKHEEPRLRAGARYPRRRGCDGEARDAAPVRPRGVPERPVVATVILRLATRGEAAG